MTWVSWVGSLRTNALCEVSRTRRARSVIRGRTIPAAVWMARSRLVPPSFEGSGASPWRNCSIRPTRSMAESWASVSAGTRSLATRGTSGSEAAAMRASWVTPSTTKPRLSRMPIAGETTSCRIRPKQVGGGRLLLLLQEPDLQVAGHGHQLEGVDAGPDGVGQLFFAPGLDEVAADLAAVDRLDHRADVRVGRQDHANDVGEPLLDGGAELGAGHLGHPLIGQQHRDRLARQDLQRLAPRAGGDDAEPVLEPETERVQVARVVVDVEDRGVGRKVEAGRGQGRGHDRIISGRLFGPWPGSHSLKQAPHPGAVIRSKEPP